MRGWRYIEDKNSLMYVSAFLKLARCESLINEMLNVETLHDFIQQTIPPMTQKEYEYLERDKRLLTIYNEDKSPMQTQLLPEEGEPGLHFHEFIFLLGLIAIHCTDHAPGTATLIEDFFIEKLNFKRQTSVPKYSMPETRQGDSDEESEYDSEEVESDDDIGMDEQQKQFMAFLERKQ